LSGLLNREYSMKFKIVKATESIFTLHPFEGKVLIKSLRGKYSYFISDTSILIIFITGDGGYFVQWTHYDQHGC
jgi:hypothetical protein